MRTILAAALAVLLFSVSALAAPAVERMPALYKFQKVKEKVYSCASYVPGMDVMLRVVDYDLVDAGEGANWFAARAWFLEKSPARPIIVVVVADVYADSPEVTVYIDADLDGNVDVKFPGSDENFPGACQVIQKNLKSS